MPPGCRRLRKAIGFHKRSVEHVDGHDGIALAPAFFTQARGEIRSLCGGVYQV
ncbi:hypothetical protein BN135_3572 [Cronobacter muytjensii 530]